MEKEIKSRTEKGAEIITTIENGEIRAEIIGKDISFHVSGWATHDGTTGMFGIGNLNGKRVRIVLTIPKSDWEKIDGIAKAQTEKLTAQAMNLEITGFRYEMGCDSASQYDIIYEENEIPFDILYKRIEADEHIITALKEMNLREIIENLNHKKIEATMSTYGGWELGKKETQKLLAEVAKFKQEKETKKAELKQKRNDERKTYREEAERTGKPVEMSRYMTDECTENLYDCSFDLVRVYMMPDGSIQEKITHCH